MALIVPPMLTTPAEPVMQLVEFTLSSGPPGPSGQAWHPGEPIRLAPQAVSAADEPPPQVPTQPRFRTAIGFGQQVPLSFAATQIVPRGVHITYGAGVDPESPVSWRGGGPWNRVLATAVMPLGYQAVIGHLSVEIRKIGD